MRHVRQEHSHECGIACMAMVMGVTLDEARAAYERVYPGKRGEGRGVSEGITYVEIDAVLAEHGFATARVWHGPRDSRREVWPPEPFADAHIATVILANGGHFVVWLRDGAVLDPNASTPRTIADYPNISSVGGVVPLVAT